MKRGSWLDVLRNFVAEALAEWYLRDPSLFHHVLDKHHAQRQVANLQIKRVKVDQAFCEEIARHEASQPVSTAEETKGWKVN